MPTLHYVELPISGAQSLTWNGDRLVDWLASVATYGLDGSRTDGRINYAYAFDAVVKSPSAEFTVLYQRLGTKGLVLRGESVVREIDRSFYHADRYDYPIALFRLPDGREALAHCPAQYNQLQIDLLETGERLTHRPEGSPKPVDVFHSGLAVDPDGTWLMSAGWLWHPLYVVNIYSMSAVLRDPTLLDQGSLIKGENSEIASATFLCADRAALVSSPDAEDFHDDDPEAGLRPGELGVYRLSTKSWESRARMTGPAGRMLAVDKDHVLALYGYPKLIHLQSGRVVDSWPEIPSGRWDGCIGRASSLREDTPPMAWDPVGRRLAIAASDRIHILQIT